MPTPPAIKSDEKWDEIRYNAALAHLDRLQSQVALPLNYT